MMFADLFGHLEALGKTYAQDVFKVLSPGASKAFEAFVGVWFMWQMILAATVFNVNIPEVMKKLGIFIIIACALSGGNLYWEWCYNPLLSFTEKTSAAMLRVGPSKEQFTNVGTGTSGSMKGIIENVEKSLEKVEVIRKAIANEATFTNFIAPFFTSLILGLCFFFMMGLFMAYMLEGIFKLLAVTALSPILFICYGFDNTKWLSAASIRVVLNGMLTVILASVAMGFTLAAVQQIIGDNIPFQNGTFMGNTKEFSTSKEYWGVILVGFVGILFHLKAAQVSASLTGVSDGPGVAALVTGAAMAPLLFAKTKLASMGKQGLQALGDHAYGNLRRPSPMGSSLNSSQGNTPLSGASSNTPNIPMMGLLLCLFLGGCSSLTEEPVGIGSNPDELKISPCLAKDMEPFYVNGQWKIER